MRCITSLAPFLIVLNFILLITFTHGLMISIFLNDDFLDKLDRLAIDLREIT